MRTNGIRCRSLCNTYEKEQLRGKIWIYAYNFKIYPYENPMFIVATITSKNHTRKCPIELPRFSFNTLHAGLTLSVLFQGKVSNPMSPVLKSPSPYSPRRELCERGHASWNHDHSLILFFKEIRKKNRACKG